VQGEKRRVGLGVIRGDGERGLGSEVVGGSEKGGREGKLELSNQAQAGCDLFSKQPPSIKSSAPSLRSGTICLEER